MSMTPNPPPWPKLKPRYDRMFDVLGPRKTLREMKARSMDSLYRWRYGNMPAGPRRDQRAKIEAAANRFETRHGRR